MGLPHLGVYRDILHHALPATTRVCVWLDARIPGALTRARWACAHRTFF